MENVDDPKYKTYDGTLDMACKTLSIEPGLQLVMGPISIAFPMNFQETSQKIEEA